MADPDVMQLLGRIDGKLDQVIESAKEHREDDKRRFADVYDRLDNHEKDINQAKGAKGALLWAAGAIAGVVAFVAPALAKKMGWL